MKSGVLPCGGMKHPSNPAWFGRRYPGWDDLLAFAESLGCLVARADIGEHGLFVAGEDEEPPVIIIPEHDGLSSFWTLAHELGHLVQHVGPRGELLHDKDEAQADRWAARALIPRARVAHHRNASLDAFIGALSAHYEELPLEDCPARRLAARIAHIRLKAVEEVA